MALCAFVTAGERSSIRQSGHGKVRALAGSRQGVTREFCMGIAFSGRFILASASPRRIELLKLMGIDFAVVPSGVDETFQQGANAREHVLRLSQEKALAVSKIG